jgi:hypothetical protein
LLNRSARIFEKIRAARAERSVLITKCFKEGRFMDFVFGPIYPYTPGTWIGVAFWWLNILGVAIAVVAAMRKDDDANGDGGGNGR